MRIALSIKSVILTVNLVIIFVVAYELYLRNKGMVLDYDDNPELWADKRASVYAPKEQASVFIGSSRLKYDLDIAAWQQATGTEAIQLAMVGSSPIHILHDLGNDPRFKGNLIVDVTEFSFFSLAPRVNISPDEAIAYFHKQTPAQKAGFVINHFLESGLVFLNKDFFSINALLEHIPLKNREGIPPPFTFPYGFDLTQFNRQSGFSDEFITDTVKKNAVKSNWAISRKRSMAHPVTGRVLDSILLTIKHDVDQIRQRGGEVTFVRPPSSGPFILAEHKSFPREKYWDRLLSLTNSKGVYFEDYPPISHFVCPEDSHLQPRDARIYTTYLVSTLKNNIGMKFTSAR